MEKLWKLHRITPALQLTRLSIRNIGKTTITKDHFTHCVRKDAKSIQQIVVQTLNADEIVSGKFGHNSNTDAKAQLQQFRACIKNPEVSAASSCKVCGKNRVVHAEIEKVRQWPCINSSNEAATTLLEVDNDKKYPKIDDSNLGTYQKQSPVCWNNNRPVNGM